jgi:glycosyltransferase involved in cell wall biosynthesis
MRLRYVPAPTGRGVEAFVHSGLSAGAATFGGYDVIHFHAMGPGLFSPLSRASSGAAVVQTIHGLDNEREKWGGGAKRVLGAAAWLSAHVPDEVITVSEDLSRHYREHWGRATTEIRNAAPVPAQEAATTAPPVDGPYVLFAGRIVPEKRIDDLVVAFRSLPGDVRLVIAGGSGAADAYARHVGELAADDPRVRLLGHVERADLEVLYAHAEAFVLPSVLEGMPVALLEAAAAGAPVIASDIPPHREILDGGPGRRLFPIGDRAALAAMLESVLSHREAEVAGAQELKRSVLSRTWRDVALATLVVYEKAIFGEARTAERRAVPRLTTV